MILELTEIWIIVRQSYSIQIVFSAPLAENTFKNTCTGGSRIKKNRSNVHALAELTLGQSQLKQSTVCYLI